MEANFLLYNIVAVFALTYKLKCCYLTAKSRPALLGPRGR